MKLDTSYLTMHPRTRLWREQRELCLSCAHMELRDDSAMRCTVTVLQPTTENSKRRIRLLRAYLERNLIAHCIDAREPEQVCGPAGALYKARGT